MNNHNHNHNHNHQQLYQEAKIINQDLKVHFIIKAVIFILLIAVCHFYDQTSRLRSNESSASILMD